MCNTDPPNIGGEPRFSRRVNSSCLIKCYSLENKCVHFGTLFVGISWETIICGADTACLAEAHESTPDFSGVVLLVR